MLGRQTIADQFERQLNSHPASNLPQSPTLPPGNFIQQHFPPSYFESTIHYQQHFYDPHQFFPGRNYHRDALTSQQAFHDRKLMLFPDGNLSFISNPSEHGQLMFDGSGCLQKHPVHEEAYKWSTPEKQNLKNRDLECSFAEDEEEHAFQRGNPMSPEMHNLSGEGHNLKESFYAYHGNHQTSMNGPMTKESSNTTVNDETKVMSDCSLNSPPITNNKNKNIDGDNNKGTSQPPWNWMRKQSYSSDPTLGL